MADEATDRRTEMEERWGAVMAAAQSVGVDDSDDSKARAAYEHMLSELLPVVRRMVRAKLFDPS